ncbi:MAG: dTMP kinase [Clostridia bacterium]|nr:dTMP kinase [Clostridia bacterium]
MRGWFISFEGPDKAGKSTQLALFCEYLTRKGIQFHLTREPGGTPVGERIRDIILDPNSEMNDMCEAMLYAAARSESVQRVLLPRLNAGQNVLSDRYVDSSIVYQGAGRGLGVERVAALNRFATDDLLPDMTVYLSLSPQKAFSRMTGEKDRLEQAGPAFHEKVFAAYEALAAADTGRFCVIDAAQSVEAVHAAIVSAFEARFGA